MNREVASAIAELERAFATTAQCREDGQGGAHVLLPGVELGDRFTPARAWLGAHIPALYPYADIYPVFMDPEVRRNDGRAFEVPITPNARFLDQPAFQISRRNNQVQHHPQTAVAKFVKIVDFLRNLP